RPLRIVHTALHGVGGAIVPRALRAAGHGDVVPVASQRDADPAFSTVSAPNPEEPGALDAALAQAAAVDADLVLANDPDVDRLAVAVPDAGGWRVLTGNEVAVLLADRLLSLADTPRPLLVTTVVSTPMLADVA